MPATKAKPKANVKLKLKRGDTVEVIAGKDKGKRGKVRTVLPKAGRVVIENINVYKRHVKRGRARQTGWWTGCR